MARPGGKQGKRYKSQLLDPQTSKYESPMEFWAENGFCCMEDQATGEFYAVSVDEFAARAKAISDMASTEPFERKRIMLQMASDMCDCAKEAESQGNPFDPEVIAHYNRHRPRPSLVINRAVGPMPGSKEWFEKKDRERGHRLVLPPGTL